jgi:hypothetical protein
MVKMHYVTTSGFWDIYKRQNIQTFLVSYWYDKNAKLIEKIRGVFPKAHVILDSGAYSARYLGAEVRLDKFIDYCHEHKHLVDKIVSLDVMDPEHDPMATESIANYNKMRDSGLNVMPVFHKGEDKSIMKQYLKTAKMVGLGANSIRDKRIYHNYLNDILKMIPNDIYVHLFGVMAMELLLKFNNRLSSCDSTTVIRRAQFNSSIAYSGMGKTCIGGTTRLEPEKIYKLHEYTLYRYKKMQDQLDEMLTDGRIQH